MSEVVLYTRPDCGLCDRARERLLALLSGSPGHALREVDIEEDARLRLAYLERIPVVEVGGEVVSELWLDEAALSAALADAGEGARLDTVPEMRDGRSER